MRFLRCVVALIFAITLGLAQNRAAKRPPYVLGPKDHILIRASQSDKLNGKIFQVEPNGFLDLPSVGRVRAAGLMVESFEKLLAGRLRPDSTGQHKVLISVVNCSPSRPTCFDSLTRK